MRSVLKSIAVLSFCVLPVILQASPAADAVGPAVEAHLAKADDLGARAHVLISLKRPDVSEVTVELFDAEGNAIGSQVLQPRQGDRYRVQFIVDLSPAMAAKVQSARVTGFTIRSSGKREELFDTGRLKAVPNSCIGSGQCNPTRIECNNICGCLSCASATYSCVDNGGGCEATCTCFDCMADPPWCL